MPKYLTPEQRQARRKKWLTSPRSRYGYHYRLDHELLTRYINRGLGVRAIAKRMHTYVPCVRRLLKKHGLKLPSQPADSAAFNEHNRWLHEEKLARFKSKSEELKMETRPGTKPVRDTLEGLDDDPGWRERFDKAFREQCPMANYAQILECGHRVPALWNPARPCDVCAGWEKELDPSVPLHSGQPRKPESTKPSLSRGDMLEGY